MGKEIWKPIRGYTGLYEISNHGRVKSLVKKKGFVWKEETILNFGYCSQGRYYAVTLRKNNKPKTFSVHRLVAKTFLPRIKGKKCVNHIDADKYNNNIDNLEWCDILYNTRHAIRVGLRDAVGEANPKVKLTEKEVLKIIKSKDSVKTLMNKYSIGQTQIYYIKNGKSWSHLSREKLFKNEKNYGSKLQPNDAKNIFLSKKKNNILAKLYSVTIQTVQNIKNQRTWKHITENL